AASTAVRGPLASLSMLLFVIAIVRMSAREEFDLKNCYFAMFSVSAIAQLASGGRLYVVTCVVALLVYHTCYIGKVKSWHLVIIALIGLLVTGTIAVLRIGTVENALALFVWNFAGESYYTSISLVDYLNHYHEPIFAFPSKLSAGFYN